MSRDVTRWVCMLSNERHPVRSAIAVIACLSALAVVGTANAAPAECVSSVNAVAFNADFGLKPYLAGIGTPGWVGKQRIGVAPITARPCDPAALPAYSTQLRFYTLLRAFPASPTRTQWKARFRPLMQTALRLDTQILAILKAQGATLYYGRLVTADRAWLAAHAMAPYGSLL